MAAIGRFLRAVFPPIEPQTVRIAVINGVAYAEEVPPGVIVQIADYDVPNDHEQHDADGRACSTYSLGSLPQAA